MNWTRRVAVAALSLGPLACAPSKVGSPVYDGLQDGVSVEVIDLRSLSPVDWDAIAASVKKTGKVLVAYEDALSWGYGAEIAARLGDACFPWLDAPVRRVASTDTFVGYAPDLEDFILPQTEDLTQAMRELHAF